VPLTPALDSVAAADAADAAGAAGAGGAGGAAAAATPPASSPGPHRPLPPSRESANRTGSVRRVYLCSLGLARTRKSSSNVAPLSPSR
jgi:hypothetical protein